jgi:hypothetical protein
MKRITDETPTSATHVEAAPRLIDREIDVRGVAYTTLGILGLTAVAAVGMWWLLASFLSGAEEADPRPAPAVAAAPRELPPGPRLQASPEAEWDRMVAREEEILSSYGRTAGGGVRIPIERAIEVLAARGETLAVGTAEATQPPAAGGEAGGGGVAGARPPAEAPSAFGAGAAGASDPHAGHDHSPPAEPAAAAGAEDGE